MNVSPAPRLRARLSILQQLTLANGVVLAVGFGAMLLLVTWLADRFMVRHVAESVDAEVHILKAELGVDGAAGVAALIRQRVQNHSPNHDRTYLLLAPDGRAIAGNLAQWPDGARQSPPDVDFYLDSRVAPHQTRVVAQWTQLADGSRLLVGYDELEVLQVRRDLRRAAAVGFGATLVLVLLLASLLTRVVLRPVEGIRRAALRIMEGDLHHRIPLRNSADEFDRLGATLNAMLDRIQHLIATVKGATDNIAHDLRSPLTRLRARLEAELRDPALAAAPRQALERGVADLDQVLATFQSLLRIASVESGSLRSEFSDCDLSALLEDVAEYVEPVAEERGQRIVRRIEPGLRMAGHRDLLFQAALNLLDNAIKFSPPDQAIELVAEADHDQVHLSVADHGPGIPAEERERVFERLYRLDRSRSTPGLGLGLSLVQAIVHLHHGSIAVLDNAPGTRVRIALPQNL